MKVWAERNILVIKGGGEKVPQKGDYDPAMSRYSHRIEMPAGAYKMDKIKAEMKNFVLKLTVPKVKEEERKDVFQVRSSREASRVVVVVVALMEDGSSLAVVVVVLMEDGRRECERRLVDVIMFRVFLPCFASLIVLDRRL